MESITSDDIIVFILFLSVVLFMAISLNACKNDTSEGGVRKKRMSKKIKESIGLRFNKLKNKLKSKKSKTPKSNINDEFKQFLNDKHTKLENELKSVDAALAEANLTF